MVDTFRPDTEKTRTVESGTQYVEIVEEYYQRGLSDGWPVYPPSDGHLRALIAAAGLPADHLVGVVRERGKAITVEKIGVNAMLAGCLPEYMPVVMAAVEAVLDPKFNLGSMMSTAGAAPLIIVHGPVIQTLGVHSGVNLFHCGARANVTIGRAIGLILRNVLGGKAGIFDQSTLGHPGKYSYCIAEGDCGPWPPLHTTRGFSEDESAVTVFAGEAPFQVHNDFSLDADGIVRTIASGICAGRIRGGVYTVILCPEHSTAMQKGGFTRTGVQEVLALNAVRKLAELKREGWLPGPCAPGDEHGEVRAVSSPEDILVVCAGGQAGRFSAIIRSWGGSRESLPVTKRVRV